MCLFYIGASVVDTDDDGNVHMDRQVSDMRIDYRRKSYILMVIYVYNIHMTIHVNQFNLQV